MVSSSQILIRLRSSEQRILKQACLRSRRRSPRTRARAVLRSQGSLNRRRCSLRYPGRPLEPLDQSRPYLPIAPIQLQHSPPFAQLLCSARTCPCLQASYWIFSRCLRCLILLPRDRLEAIGTRRRASPMNLFNYSAVYSTPCPMLIDCLCVSSPGCAAAARDPGAVRYMIYDSPDHRRVRLRVHSHHTYATTAPSPQTALIRPRS